MSQILADAEMEKTLEAATGLVAVVNKDGKMIGYVKPMTWKHTPYTPEELAARKPELDRRREEARKHPERGKTTAEVLAHLRSLEGGQS